MYAGTLPTLVPSFFLKSQPSRSAVNEIILKSTEFVANTVNLVHVYLNISNICNTLGTFYFDNFHIVLRCIRIMSHLILARSQSIAAIIDE